MIAKCIVILALVAQIKASGCGCGLFSMGGSTFQPSPVNLVSSSNSGFADTSSRAVMRNLVAKGKYPVALRNCGPAPGQQLSVINSRVTTPVQEKPIIRLPTSIPAPRTISHSCTCYKTILRPQVHQQLITVPTVQRYVETLHKPFLENIQYEAIPVTCDGSGVQFFQIGTSSSGSNEVATVGSGSFGSHVQNIASVLAPQIQSVKVPHVQNVETQRVQPFQIPEIQTVQIPQPVSFGSCSCHC